jgi:hypothetical protein
LHLDFEDTDMCLLLMAFLGLESENR